MFVEPQVWHLGILELDSSRVFSSVENVVGTLLWATIESHNPFAFQISSPVISWILRHPALRLAGQQVALPVHELAEAFFLIGGNGFNLAACGNE